MLCTVWPVKRRQMSIKVAQKRFHKQNERFWQLYKDCLKCGQLGQNNYCHRLWKVAQSAINRPIWSHWLGPSDWLTDVSKQEKVSKFIKVELASKLFNWQPPKDSFGRVQSTLIDFPLDLSITSDEVRQWATQMKRTWRKWPNMPGWINFRPAMSWFFAYLGSR